MLRRSVICLSLLLLPGLEPKAPAQNGLEQFRAFQEHPRLLLTPRRVRLLRREAERQSLRWESWKRVYSRQPKQDEPGFAHALYYQVTGEAEASRKAVEWALSDIARDLRQIAFVFDWCQPLLSQEESKRLAAKLEAGLRNKPLPADLDGARTQVLAALALSGHASGTIAEERVREFLERWWPEKIAAPVLAERNPIDRDQFYALFETLHAVRDNLQIELREKIPGYFKDLPLYYVIGHYPAPLLTTVGLFRIPSHKGMQEPDPLGAELSRAAGLAMVAYDGNAQEAQFTQGWLIDDRYLLQSSRGAPYEFLWANPYLPGLPFDRMPSVFNQPVFSELFARSDWHDDGEWLGYFDGEVQIMREGTFSTRKLEPEVPLEIGGTILLMGGVPMKISIPGHGATRLFLLGLPANRAFDLELEAQSVIERKTDSKGVLEMALTPEAPVEMMLHEVGQPPVRAAADGL